MHYTARSCPTCGFRNEQSSWDAIRQNRRELERYEAEQARLGAMTPEEIEREREKKAAAFKAQQRRWKLQNELEQLSTGMFFIGFVLFMFGLAADPTRFDLTVGGSVVVVLAVLLYFISQR